MKNILHNIISFLLVSCILIAVFYEYPVENKVDFKKQIVEFTNFEDSRDINKVLTFFEFPLLNYWEHKKISEIELKKIYLRYWERFEYSENEIQKIDKISDYEVLLITKYIFKKSITSKLNRYRLSETKFKFNKSGKITSIINLSIKKIDLQYIIDNNLIRDFSYVENIPQKNNLELAPFFAILLILNLSIQVVGSVKKTEKERDTPNEFEEDGKQQKLKDEIEINRLIKIEDTEILRQRDLKETAKRDVLIKLEKEKIEKEKNERDRINWGKIAAEKKRQRELEAAVERKLFIKLAKERIEAEKKEAARIKRNKLAREKRVEEKRLAQLQKAKDVARIKREKLEIKKTEDKEREKREKEELELNDSTLNKQQELVKSNIEIVDQNEDTFFDDNLSQYITEIPDDDIDEEESDIGDFLTDKYMPQNLKNKLKNK